MGWKFILVLFFSISLVSSFSSVDQWHSLLEIATESGYLVDQNSNGIIDAGNSLTAPSSSNNVDTSLPYHPISEVGISQGNLIDLNGNGWPDVCQSLTPPSLTIRPTLEYETLSQISFSNSDLRSIDSNKDGWPDKCDCILSLTGTDNNNCGSCGNVCPGGGACVGGVCCNPNMGQACGPVCNQGTIDCAGNCVGTTNKPAGTSCGSGLECNGYGQCLTPYVYTLTEAPVWDGNGFGYRDVIPRKGAISPTTLTGVYIGEVYWDNRNWFNFYIYGSVVPQNYFTSIQPYAGGPVFNTADADMYHSGSGFGVSISRWEWHDVSQLYDGVGQSTVKIWK